jgi:hypothetical protein
VNIREMIAKATNPNPEPFTPAGFEAPLYLRRMTIAQLFEYLAELKDKNPVEAAERTLCIAIVDEHGAPVFKYEDEADRKMLSSLPPKVAMEITYKFRDLNRMGETAASAPDAS